MYCVVVGLDSGYVARAMHIMSCGQITGGLCVTSLSLYIKYIKHFQKMYRDVGMAMPKTTETRCRDGSVQGRHVIQRLHN